MFEHVALASGAIWKQCGTSEGQGLSRGSESPGAGLETTVKPYFCSLFFSADVSCSCCYAMTECIPLEQNKPFLPPVTFVGLFYLSHEKVRKTVVCSHILQFLSSISCISHSTLAFSSHHCTKLLIGLPRPKQTFLMTHTV